MTQDTVHLSPMSPLGIVGHDLGKVEVQGSNPCRGTTRKRLKLLKKSSFRRDRLAPRNVRIMGTIPKSPHTNEILAFGGYWRDNSG